MNKQTYEHLQNVLNKKEKSLKNIELCNAQLEAIYDICDHTYPDGTSAIENGGCKLCGYVDVINNECKHLNTESTHPYGWIVCKDCGKLLT